MQLTRRTLSICSFFVCLSALSAHAQDADDAVVQKFSSLEILKQAIAEGAEALYGTLPQVSPRDLSIEERTEAVQLLKQVLSNRYPDVRGRAAETLGVFGEDAAVAIPELMKLLHDEELKVDLKGVWVSASESLGKIGTPALPSLLEVVPDCERVVYLGVMGALYEMGADADAAAPLLIKALKEGPEDRRWATIYALSQMGDAALPAIPEYIKQLDHENFNLHVIACRALAELGPAAKEAAPKLLELIENGLLSSRTHAAMCLGAIGPVEGVDSVQIFMDMAEEKNAFCQERAMIALGRMGSHAVQATELIESLIPQEEFSQKPEAAEALWRITGNSQRTLELLEQWIDSKTFDMRVMDVLIKMGPDAAPFADRFIAMLSSEDQSLRQLAVSAIENFGVGAKPFLPMLRKALPDSDRGTALAIDAAILKIEQASE